MKLEQRLALLDRLDTPFVKVSGGHISDEARELSQWASIQLSREVDGGQIQWLLDHPEKAGKPISTSMVVASPPIKKRMALIQGPESKFVAGAVLFGTGLTIALSHVFGPMSGLAFTIASPAAGVFIGKGLRQLIDRRAAKKAMVSAAG